MGCLGRSKRIWLCWRSWYPLQILSQSNIAIRKKPYIVAVFFVAFFYFPIFAPINPLTHKNMHLLTIGTTEIIIIVALVLLLFGGKKIPELMKGLGKGVKSFKDGVNGVEEPEIKADKETKE